MSPRAVGAAGGLDRRAARRRGRVEARDPWREPGSRRSRQGSRPRPGYARCRGTSTTATYTTRTDDPTLVFELTNCWIWMVISCSSVLTTRARRDSLQLCYRIARDKVQGAVSPRAAYSWESRSVCCAARMVQARERIRNVEMLLNVTSFCFVLVGIAAFYKDFVEALYENLGGQASVTGNCIMHFSLCSMG